MGGGGGGGAKYTKSEYWVTYILEIFPNIKAKLSVARFQASHYSCDEEIGWMNDSIINF